MVGATDVEVRCGVVAETPSRRPPGGLPHGGPGAELGAVRSHCIEGCSRAAVWSGCARSTGWRQGSTCEGGAAHARRTTPPAEPTNPAPRTATFTSVSEGSHPASGAAYILILTVSGMAGPRQSPSSQGRREASGARHLLNLPEGAITPAPGGKSDQAGTGVARMLPPGAGVIGATLG